MFPNAVNIIEGVLYGSSSTSKFYINKEVAKDAEPELTFDEFVKQNEDKFSFTRQSSLQSMLNDMKHSEKRKKEKELSARIKPDFGVLSFEDDWLNGKEAEVHEEPSDLQKNMEEFSETEAYMQKQIDKLPFGLHDISTTVDLI